MSLAFSVWCRSPRGFSLCLPRLEGLLVGAHGSTVSLCSCRAALLAPDVDVRFSTDLFSRLSFGDGNDAQGYSDVWLFVVLGWEHIPPGKTADAYVCVCLQTPLGYFTQFLLSSGFKILKSILVLFPGTVWSRAMGLP